MQSDVEEPGVGEAPGDESGATDEASAAPVTGETASDQPKVRKINGPAAEPIDLMDVSGSSILKRAAPAIVALLIILFFLRRRS